MRRVTKERVPCAAGVGRWDARPEDSVRKYPRETVDRTEGNRPKQYGNTSSLPSLYHCWPLESARIYPTQQGVQTDLWGKFMNTGYSNWLGRAVVLHVEVGDIKVPLRGKLLKENPETVRMRIGEGWDVDIYKTMILDVQEDLMAMIPA